jgi:hypothetical protein
LNSRTCAAALRRRKISTYVQKIRSAALVLRAIIAREQYGKIERTFNFFVMLVVDFALEPRA